MNTAPETSKDTASKAPKIGRNDPCTCGSGKKYKRCHGATASPAVAEPATPTEGAALNSDAPAGFDPSQFDPAQMMEMAKVLRRLPKGQVQRLQTLIQQAMMGRDVTQEMLQLQSSLPLDVQQMFLSMGAQGQATGTEDPTADPKAKRGFFKRMFKG